MEDLRKEPTDPDDTLAYEISKRVAAASESTPEYYPYLDVFASLLDHKKSYVRTRAFILICSQARWDETGKIGPMLPQMMQLLHDPKPTVVRQCLNAIKELVVFRPELCKDLRGELDRIDLSNYKDSMSPLIQKDIGEVLELLNGIGF